MDDKSVVKNIMKSSLETITQTVLDILEADKGTSFGEKKAAAMDYLKSCRNNSVWQEGDVPGIDNMAEESIQRSFWKQGESLQVSDGIILRKVEAADREEFKNLQFDFPVLNLQINKEAYYDAAWAQHIASQKLMFSIIQNGEYIGYCGIRNILCEPWEIEIEIKTEWRRHGIGSKTVAAVLDEIKARLGISIYRVRIDPGNYASQRLFERLGAVPNGISSLWIDKEQVLEQLENEKLYLIDSQMIEIAKKFHVEPRRLLSHILEYTLSWSAKKGKE